MRERNRSVIREGKMHDTISKREKLREVAFIDTQRILILLSNYYSANNNSQKDVVTKT